jgi:hypothetical protein
LEASHKNAGLFLFKIEIFEIDILNLMTTRSKTRLTTVILLMAILQGPFLYYFTEGFIKLLSTMLFAATGIIVSLRILLELFKNRLSNRPYHICGLVLAVCVGIGTLQPSTMEWVDFNLFLGKRNEIVSQVKSKKLNPNVSSGKNDGIVTLNTWLPLSRGENQILVHRTNDGVATIEFYIDRGFVDHFSAFLYTNNPDEIQDLGKGVVPSEFGVSGGGGAVKKLRDHWYRIAN